jgi:hypothetical protein
LGIGLGNPPVIGYLLKNRDVVRRTERVHAIITDSDPIDHHTHRQTKRSHHLDGQGQIVEAEWRRLRHQDYRVGTPYRGDHRA